MTVSQALRRFRQIVSYDLDPICGQYPEGGSSEEQTDWCRDVVGFMQEAVGDLCREAALTADSTTLTLTAGQSVYPVGASAWSRRLIQPYSVLVDGRRLMDETESVYGLWSVADLVRRFPNWEQDPPGEVRRAVFRGDRLILHPAPESDGTATVEGRVGAPVIDPLELAAELPLTDELHPHVVGLAAYKACVAHSQTPGQASRLVAMLEAEMAKAKEIRRENTNAQVGSPDLVFPNRVGVMRL